MKWYYWGKWPEIMLYYSFWIEYADADVFKKLSITQIEDIKILDGHFFFLKKELNAFSQFIKNKYESDLLWFDKFFKICDEKAEAVLELDKKEDLGLLMDAIIQCLCCSFLVEFIDFATQQYLKEKTGENFSEIIQQMNPHKKTDLMKYQEQLSDMKDLDSFVEKYKWVGTHGFKGKPLSKKVVESEGKNSVLHKTTTVNGKFKEYTKLLEIGSKLTYYRAYLIPLVDKISFGYWKIIKKLAEKHSLSWAEITSLTYEELINLYLYGDLNKDYKKRNNGFGIIRINKKTQIITGDKLKKELGVFLDKPEQSSEINGIPACKGKVKGIVKIINKISELTKLKKGDILITNETTPDFMVGIRKAKGIVTNIGGITSHAAIVSRELGIPCIIGTKIATKVFKDGDLVEVDANKGVVRKISKYSKRN